MKRKTSPLDIAIRKAGGPSNFARLVSETPQTVNNWRARGVAARACATVARVAKDRRVTCGTLRPDLKGTLWPKN